MKLLGGDNVVKVYEIIIHSGEKRWIVLNENGEPIKSIMKYIKYKDNLGKAPNTLKTYCYHLKLYWEYLIIENKNLNDVDLNLLSSFISWLRCSEKKDNVRDLIKKDDINLSKRSESTINLIINCVIDFYDYLYRNNQIHKDIKGNVLKSMKIKNRKFKGFLDHISSNVTFKNILKIKEPRRIIKTLTKEQAKKIHLACNNIRDELMIRIMYERRVSHDKIPCD